jgi:lipid II:glycine glycyltransferase (peptidoglycan interpeptide bridge formation enzyme)
MQRFSKKTREKSRKAERRGIVVESDGAGRLLPIFDMLYRRSMEHWAADHFLPTPVARRVIERRHDHTKLEAVARRLGQRCQVWIAWSQGEPVSGIVVLGQGPAATYWKGATDKELVRASGATDYLHKCAIEAACQAGRTRYDLGTSGLESLARFKEGLGARLQNYEAYSFERIPFTPAQELFRVGLRRAFTAAAAGRRAARGRSAAG